MSDSTLLKSETEFVLELKDRLRGKHIDQLARELGLTAEMIRGVITGKYRPGHKVAKALGYKMVTQKMFIAIEDLENFSA